LIAGKKLRFSGKGEPGAYGGPPGDLYIRSMVEDDPVFRLEGYDAYVEKEIKLSESVLGTCVLVPTPDGREVNIKIPPGTRHKTKMRLSGQGIPHMKSSKKGDLYIVIDVDVPKKLTDEQRKVFEQLAKTGL